MTRTLLLPFPILAILAGCAQTPAAVPTPSNLPARWEAASPVSTGEIPGAWWSSFDDPVLDGLIDSGQQHNVDLRIAAERVIASHALRRAATAGFFPEIRAEAGVTAARRTANDSAGIGLGASWEPDIGGRLSAAVRAARADTGATAADAEAVRLLLIEEITRAYIDYRLQRALIALTTRTVAAQEETLRITRDRFEFGMASALDVERAAALVSQTRSEQAVASEAADADRFRLAYLLSTTPENMTARLATGDAIPAADPLVVLRSPADVLAARPDIRAATARYAATAARRDGAAGLRLPSLSLSGLVGLDAGGIGSLLDGGTTIASVAAALVLPALDFGRRRAELDAADSQLRVAGLDYERVVRSALQETQTGIVSYLQGQMRERELGRAAEAARRAAALSQLQYREGTLSQLEVLDAARTVYQAERDHARALADVSARLVSLHRQMGVAPAAPVTASGGSGTAQ
ncbi:efflux transporter outer membrane subunit [Sphingomonas sp. MS122]|uniref:efflux transporter outer membrane subunit n=1 Tax=Sphingomonas sp. MS122 TaxID=3412683 RepID=UPI003C2CEEFA